MGKEIDFPLRLARMSGAAAGVLGVLSHNKETFLIGSGVFIAANAIYFTESFIEKKREARSKQDQNKKE